MSSRMQQLSLTLSDILWMRRRESFSDSNKTVEIQQQHNTRQKTTAMLLQAAVFFLFGRQSRSMWTFVRSSTWWDDVVLNSFGPLDWRNNFRNGKQTFNYLCHKLQPLIEKQNTNMRKPVSVEKHVSISLWILATSSEYCTVFGLARCTVCVIVHKICKAIIQSLQLVYISFRLVRV